MFIKNIKQKQIFALLLSHSVKMYQIYRIFEIFIKHTKGYLTQRMVTELCIEKKHLKTFTNIDSRFNR